MNRYMVGKGTNKGNGQCRGLKGEKRQTERPVAPPPKTGRYTNGDVLCQAHNDRIDTCVCTVRSFRQPGKCNGCLYKGA